VAGGRTIYRTPVLPEWVDFNGHLRDAYYVLIASYAADALMDHLGIDEPYRQRTHCTLYTLELHAGFELGCERLSEPAASIELMLLHVEQGESVRALAFPEEVARALAALKIATAGAAPARRGSRKIELRGR